MRMAQFVLRGVAAQVNACMYYFARVVYRNRGLLNVPSVHIFVTILGQGVESSNH